jgi:hypothetical protein
MVFAALNPSHTLDVPVSSSRALTEKKDISGITNTCLERAARSCASAALDGLEGALEALRESHSKRIKNLRLRRQALLLSWISLSRAASMGKAGHLEEQEKVDETPFIQLPRCPLMPNLKSHT